MRKFTKAERAGFIYTAAHWCAFQMVALNLRVWKPRHLLHDIDKPFLMLWAKYILQKEDPYSWVQQYHRTHRAHHVEYYKEATLTQHRRDINAYDIVIDWECSQFTKASSPKTAYEEYLYQETSLPHVVAHDIRSALMELQLFGESNDKKPALVVQDELISAIEPE
jgi:hypothetical protein